MNYGKLVDGVLHVYGTPAKGRKEIRDIIPEGYTKEQCQPITGGYTETKDYIGVEYAYIAPGMSQTEQRIADLETAQATTEQAVQDLILSTLAGGEV